MSDEKMSSVPYRTGGFTLIELLVVITIIVVLLALLVPALDKAIYEAELVDCGARMKAWGGMAAQFAQDHRRDLPMAFGPAGTWDAVFGNPRGPRVLDRISDITANADNGQWKQQGTPWAAWVRYGMSDRLAVCPIWRGSGAGPSANYYYDDPQNPAPQRLEDFAGLGWGPQVWIGYQWIGGTDTTQPGESNVFAWNSRRPASNLRNASGSSVLASDLLWMNSGWAPPPNNFRAIAHPSTDNPAQPRSMSILGGDGHVAIERESFFEQPLIFGDTGNPLAEQFSYRGGASYYWWGQ